MTWDSRNRMVSCSYSGNTLAFDYGSDGLRRSETLTSGGQSVTTYHVYDAQSLVMEETKNAQGVFTPSASYFNGPRGPEYKKDETTGLVQWHLYDGLGSVIGEVDPAGNVTYSAKYDVYGAVRGTTGTATTAQGFVGGLGHLSEAATGLIYMKARYYDPNTGRFVSEDFAHSGKNWYIYCNGNPVNYIDRTGKDGEMVGTMEALTGGMTADSAMDEIAANVFGVQTQDGTLTYMGNPQFTARQVLTTAGHDENLEFQMWEYWAKDTAGEPSGVLKAWLRWNGQQYDAYLQCEQDINGTSGFASHATPYIDYS